MRGRARRWGAVGLATLGLVASTLAVATTSTAPATAAPDPAAVAAKATPTLPDGFTDRVAIAGVTEPVGVAFAPDGTAFVALKTGLVKSFDPDASAGGFEPSAAATNFADLTADTNNYGDRGMTGITVDPAFPTRPYVYVNYTYNRDPRDNPPVVPRWGVPGEQYDECGPGEASISAPFKTGCPVMVRVSRLTAQKTSQGWVMAPGSEVPLVTSGCFQFSSHSSGDVTFGPDGKLYASAGDGASFLGQDYGQANNPCGDPADEGGSLRAQDYRGTGAVDPLGIDGTIFRLDPDAGLAPSQATAGQWLVAYGQRNPWRLSFRPGTNELWSVDVGSSNWEEINRLPNATSTNLVNRGWPCYEGGTPSAPLVNAAWDALDKNLCESLYPNGVNEVQGPWYSYRTRTGAAPLTPGEQCPVKSSSLSGVAFTPPTSSYPAGFKGSLYFSDFLRGCVWKLGQLPNGDPDPSSVQVFAQLAGAPVDVVAGPGGDLYYVDYGINDAGVVEGGGTVHRITWTTPASELTVKAKPRKLRVKVKVDGDKHKAGWKQTFDVGTLVKVVAPRSVRKNGVRWVFSKWKGVTGKKAKKKRKLKLTIGELDTMVKAVYRRR